MLAACLWGTLVLQPPPSSDRARGVLANGVRVVAQRVDSPGEVRIAMAASLLGAGLGRENHGFAHLLEHLAAKGPKKDIDARLELQGMALSVETTREAMVFEVAAPPELASLALDALLEIASGVSAAQEDIQKELVILAEEEALRSSAALLAGEAWSAVFGEDGLDTFGSLEVMKTAKPGDMEALHRRVFRGAGIAVSAAGDISPQAFLDRVKTRFEDLPRGAAPEPPLRSAVLPGTPLVVDGAGGAARAVLLEGMDTSSGLAVIGAAIAAARFTGSAPIFSPSTYRSLVVLPAPSQAAFAPLDEMTTGQRQMMHAEVQAMAANWIASARRSPARLARLNAELALQNPSLTPDRLVDLARSIDAAQAEQAVAAWSGERAVRLAGGLQ